MACSRESTRMDMVHAFCAAMGGADTAASWLSAIAPAMQQGPIAEMLEPTRTNTIRDHECPECGCNWICTDEQCFHAPRAGNDRALRVCPDCNGVENTRYLRGFQCPMCGSNGNFRVMKEICLYVDDNGPDVINETVGEIGDDEIMECVICEFNAEASHFRIEQRGTLDPEEIKEQYQEESKAYRLESILRGLQRGG